MGDRIAIMNHGRLQQIATPLKAYYKPANEFVAGFIGSPSMNFLPVTHDDEEGHTLEHPSFSYELSDRISDALAEAEPDLTLGIRPEDIEVAIEESPTSIEVTVDVIEPLGKEQLLYFTLDDTTYTASVTGHRSIPEGETIHLEFPSERVHVFDRGSGETIINCVMPDTDERELIGSETSDQAVL